MPWNAALARSVCGSMPVPTVPAELCSAAEVGDGWAEPIVEGLWLHCCISSALGLTLSLELGEGQGGSGSSDHSMSHAGESGPLWLWRALCGLYAGCSLTGLLMCLQVTCHPPPCH